MRALLARGWSWLGRASVGAVTPPYSLRARIAATVALVVLITAVAATYLAYRFQAAATGVLTDGGDTNHALSQLARLRHDLLELDAAAVIVGVLVGTGVAAGISRPVRRAAQAAQRLGDGDLEARIPRPGPGELAELTHSFNAMADRLSETMRSLHAARSLQQRFVSDVSHELRTPLAAMLAASDGLDSLDPALQNRAVALVQEQTRRLSRMVEDLLEMSRFDAGQATLELEAVQLVELAEDVVRTVAPDCDIRVAAFGDVVVDVDARRVHAILRNLVGNAVQHGAPPVDVVIDARTDLVSVTVADDGPGVPEELAPTVFDRFTRADTARTGRPGTASTGLGLAIALENARLHGATLEVSTTGRSAFTLRLPRRASVAALPVALTAPQPPSRP